MNIHYLQHVHFEGLGYIQSWADKHSHRLTATRFFENGQALPDLADIDALIVLGGPMSVFDEERYRWLADEKQFIKEAIDTGKKVLGICLGAQLLANVLGAVVKPAPNKEIGWFPVFPTQESRELPWFYELFSPRPIVFHWHADKFEIPYGAVNLASSDANKNQAFAVGEQLLALQFHVETTPASVRKMMEAAKADIIPGNFVQQEAELEGGLPHAEHPDTCYSLLDHFFKKDTVS